MDLPAAPAVEVAGLCRRYGRTWALAGVDLTLEPGRALLLAGRNGSGKSTLLRVLAGALRPDRGTAKIFGRHAAAARDATALLGHASYTYEALSSLENLRTVASLLGKPHARKDLLPLLEEVGLADRADDPVAVHSAGMRKRLAIARVVLQAPKLVLLDEPYAALDPPGFGLVDGLVTKLRAEGATVIVASHLLERSAAMCEEGVVLEKGRVAWRGPASALPKEAGLAE